MSTSAPSLVDLANQIGAASSLIQEYLTSKNLPNLSFAADGPTRFPEAPHEIMSARVTLLDTAKMLYDLALGPDEHIKAQVQNCENLAALNWIEHFKIAQHVPLQGSISYDDLAKSAGVEVNRLRRIVRYSMLLRYFHETIPDHVSHSAVSRLLVTNKGLQAFASVSSQIVSPASAKIVEAYERYGASTERSHTAWNVASNVADVPFYAWMEKSAPEQAKLFPPAMATAWKEPGRGVQYLFDSFDWGSLPTGSTVVDVGGNAGHISVGLANRYPHLKFVVQDLPNVVAKGRDGIPAELRERIQFMEHDFYTEQPIKDGAVYLFHWVLLDHQDDNAAQILQQTRASMKPGAKIVIRDGILLDPGSGSWTDELLLRKVDIMGMLLLNAGQRDLQTWKKVFALAGPELKLEQVNRPHGSALSVMVLGLGE